MKRSSKPTLEELTEKWNEHLKGDVDWHHELWNVLIFQAWLENNR